MSYVNGEIDQNSDFFLKAECEAGTYRVILKAFWKSFVKIFTFSLYGP